MDTDETPQEFEPEPLTDIERDEARADWMAYRIPYGANGAPAVLRAEQRAFMAGWIVRRHREAQNRG